MSQHLRSSLSVLPAPTRYKLHAFVLAAFGVAPETAVGMPTSRIDTPIRAMESNQLDGEAAGSITGKGPTPAPSSPSSLGHTNCDLESGKIFSGYRWTYFSSLQQGPLRSRAESFLASVDWLALREYAAAKRKGIDCSLLPDIGLGYNHMVRIIEFIDGVRWVARLQLPGLAGSHSSESILKTKSDCEFHTISLLRQRTNLPIPEIHAYEARSDCSVKAPFMLMDCLEGNVGMDLGMEIPPGYKQVFLSGLAKIHVSEIFIVRA